MFIRNCLRAGDFICAVPAGLQLTLQYNSLGKLEKVYKGYGNDRVDISESTLMVLVTNNIVPNTIHLKRGNSWVKGVLYIDKAYTNPGQLPGVIEDDVLADFLANPNDFEFYAGLIESSGILINGAIPVRQCLTIAKFKILPLWHIPPSVSYDTFVNWTSNNDYPFRAPLLTDYIIFKFGKVSYASTKLSQFVVTKVVKEVNISGQIKGKIYGNIDGEPIYTDYSNIVKYNIQSKSLVLLDADKQIIYSAFTDKKRRDPVSSNYTCTYCGKKFELPRTGSATCADRHCPSLFVPNIKQFLNVTGISTFTDADINRWVSKENISTICDLLELPEFENIKIDITLPNLFRAIVPITHIRVPDVFVMFADNCDNDVKTVLYYLNNVDKIVETFGAFHPDTPRLISWVSDLFNSSDLFGLLNMDKVNIIKVDKKFEGSPIFRGKTIFITGEFSRGSLADISNILQSYSAKVVTVFSNLVDCVLIGDQKENINGQAIAAARNLNIPVTEESKFFAEYGIDEDLKP